METDQIHRAASDDAMTIAGRVYGEGTPLMFVHGAMADGPGEWGELVPSLAERFTCYVLDMRSRGLGDAHPDPSRAARVRDTVAFIESIGEPVVLLEVSGGGMTSLGVTAVLDGVPLEEALEWRFTEPAGGVVSHTRIADGWLATGSMAGHVRIYDLEQRRLISDIEVQPIGPVTLAFTHDATALLYEDGRTVRRFDFDEERLRALATSRLTRGFTATECTQYRIEGAACPT